MLASQIRSEVSPSPAIATALSPPVEVYQPPYEVVEYGWGEFEAGIRIYFRDPNEQPVDVFHTILLYPSPLAQGPGKQPVVAENYDEIVFADPSPPFHAQLMLYGSVNNPNRKATAFPEHYTGFDDALDLELLATIHSHVLTEVATAKQRLINLDAEVVETMNERKAQEAAQAAHMAVQVVQQEHANAMDM